jgi:hypothetical protein
MVNTERINEKINEKNTEKIEKYHKNIKNLLILNTEKL